MTAGRATAREEDVAVVVSVTVDEQERARSIGPSLNSRVNKELGQRGSCVAERRRTTRNSTHTRKGARTRPIARHPALSEALQGVGLVADCDSHVVLRGQYAGGYGAGVDGANGGEQKNTRTHTDLNSLPRGPRMPKEYQKAPSSHAERGLSQAPPIPYFSGPFVRVRNEQRRASSLSTGLCSTVAPSSAHGCGP